MKKAFAVFMFAALLQGAGNLIEGVLSPLKGTAPVNAASDKWAAHDADYSAGTDPSGMAVSG